MASKIGATVSPPRARSANPAKITTPAMPHQTNARDRLDVSLSAIGRV